MPMRKYPSDATNNINNYAGSEGAGGFGGYTDSEGVNPQDSVGRRNLPILLRGNQMPEGVCRLRGRLISEGVSGLRERVNHSEGFSPQVQVGERHLPRLIGRCHGSRRLGRRLKSRRLIGFACLPRRIHSFQQTLFP
jgi:hypothetical protein